MKDVDEEQLLELKAALSRIGVAVLEGKGDDVRAVAMEAEHFVDGILGIRILGADLPVVVPGLTDDKTLDDNQFHAPRVFHPAYPN